MGEPRGGAVVPTSEEAREAMEGLRRWLTFQALKYPGIPQDEWLNYRANIRFGSNGAIWVESESLTVAWKVAHPGDGLGTELGVAGNE